MTDRPRPLLAGNWKMNGRPADTDVLQAVAASYDEGLRQRLDVLVCPPATLISAFAAAAQGTGIVIGGQDCHAAPSGAHTGDVSAEMLRDAGASHVIVGHSERRADHHETDALVRGKAGAARRAGLVAIVCIGETEAERAAGRALEVVTAQVSASLPAGATAANTVLAYEPVWAIGSGRTPSLEEVAEVHAAIRATLSGLTDDWPSVRILYGGSVKPANAAALMALPDVDGALVGGASLKAADFLGIAAAWRCL